MPLAGRQNGGIVLSFQHAEIPHAVAVLAQVHFIYLGRYSPHWQAVPDSQPDAPAGVIEKVIAGR